MSPVLGIIASSTQQGRGGGPVGSYDSLATFTVPTGGLTSITFAGIPTDYQHLQLRFSAINASSQQSTIMRYNNDTSSSYAKHALYGYGNGTAYSAGYATQGYFNLQGYTSGSVTPYPVVGVADILDYANVNKNKTTRILSGWNGNSTGQGEVGLLSGLWQSLSAISSLTISLESGGTFAVNSSFSLYGVK